MKTLTKPRDASRLGSFPTPTVEGGRGSPLAEQEGWAKWRQLGSFESPVVACQRSASAVAEKEGWAKWRQLGSFLSPTIACEWSASAVAEQEGWAKWRQLGSFFLVWLSRAGGAFGRRRVRRRLDKIVRKPS